MVTFYDRFYTKVTVPTDPQFFKNVYFAVFQWGDSKIRGDGKTVQGVSNSALG